MAISLPRWRGSEPELNNALNLLAESIEKVSGKRIVAGPNMQFIEDEDSIILDSMAVAGGGSSARSPWDIYGVSGVGEPNPQTGAYSNYSCNVWPATVGNIVPSNMLEVFTIPNKTTKYLVLSVQSSSWSVTQATLSFDNSPTGTVAVTQNTAPTTFKILLGAIKLDDGLLFNANFIGSSLLPSVVAVAQTTRSNPPPNESPYDFYYSWRW